MTRFSTAREHLHTRGGNAELRRHARRALSSSSDSCQLTLKQASSRLAQRNGSWTHRQTFNTARLLMTERPDRFTCMGDALRWLATHDFEQCSADWSLHFAPRLVEKMQRATSARARAVIESFWNEAAGAVLRFCELLGLRRVVMPADNDCQFWAMMHQLKLHDIATYPGTMRAQQKAVRRAVIDWIEEHLDEDVGDVTLQTLVEACEGSVDRFLHNMRRGRGEHRWGGELTLIACSLCFRVHVQVIHERGLRYCRSYASPSFDPDRCITVFYDGVGHYDSLAP